MNHKKPTAYLLKAKAVGKRPYLLSFGPLDRTITDRPDMGRIERM